MRCRVPACRVTTVGSMGTVNVQTSATIGASAEATYALIAESAQRPAFLPEAMSGFETLEGGTGAGTVHRWVLKTPRGDREYVMAVTEPEPGRVLVESDQKSSLVTTWTVTPTGESCTVDITTTWQGAGGIGGFFEKTFAPKALSKIYRDQLARLDELARRT